jgi:F0F1-type ATP synthase assembly protein I
MNKLRDLSKSGTIIIVCLMILLLYYWYDNMDEIDQIRKIDADKNGVVTKAELRDYLIWIEKTRRKKRIRLVDIAHSMYSGFIRGLLMGLILRDFEGGITLGLILGIINPVISGAEKVTLINPG